MKWRTDGECEVEVSEAALEIFDESGANLVLAVIRLKAVALLH